jgi:hypothetical protein
MKIGILLSAYNSEEYIDECLTPWFNLKEQYNITICCNSGMFKDYADYGYTSKNKTTLQKLVNFDIDFLISTGPKSRLDEITSKNTLLRILKNSCDIVWILDSDEFYTEKEIINIIDYINCTPEYDWYSVNFRNYTFTKNLFLDGFSPPRIFRTDRNEGINEFYFDNHINYNDGEDFENKNNNTIPRDIAWIKHYTWLNEDSRSKEKIRYHIERFIGGCSFEWDENLDSLKFSESFYNSRNLEIPVLHEKIDWLSNEFTIDFARNENKFYVKNITKPQSLDFKFFDGQTGDQIYNTNLDLSPDITYFVWPTSTMFKDIDGFKKFRVEVTADKKIIHNEFIHI